MLIVNKINLLIIESLVVEPGLQPRLSCLKTPCSITIHSTSETFDHEGEKKEHTIPNETFYQMPA